MKFNILRKIFKRNKKVDNSLNKPDSNCDHNYISKLPNKSPKLPPKISNVYCNHNYLSKLPETPEEPDSPKLPNNIKK